MERDLVIFDLETTGVNPEADRIVQIAAVRRDVELNLFVDPGVPIPQHATDVHGVTNDMVVDKPVFADVADEVLAFVGDADLGGYNILAFDIPMLQAELARCDKTLDLTGRRLVDGLAIFRHFEPRTLVKALLFYADRDHVGAHGALADARAAADVIREQAKWYDADLDELARVSIGDRITLDGKVIRNEAGEPSLSFGKYKHVALEKVERSYLRWLLGTELSRETDAYIRCVLEGS